MILNELANQVNKVRSRRVNDIRRSRIQNLAIGVGVGSVLGVATGILFAPKSGKETRQIIADKTSETVKNFQDDLSATKAKISTMAAEKGSRLREAGHKGVEAIKDTLKAACEDKKEESSK